MKDRKLDIPPPITEENRDQYLEELSKTSETENWVEKHSIQNNGNQEMVVFSASAGVKGKKTTVPTE